MAGVAGLEPANAWVKATCLADLATPQYWSSPVELNKHVRTYKVRPQNRRGRGGWSCAIK